MLRTSLRAGCECPQATLILGNFSGALSYDLTRDEQVDGPTAAQLQSTIEVSRLLVLLSSSCCSSSFAAATASGFAYTGDVTRVQPSCPAHVSRPGSANMDVYHAKTAQNKRFE